MNKSIIVGMSGGVDSAVAAYLLKKEGYQVTGCTLKFGKKNNKCCLIDDAAIAADTIGIEHVAIDVHDVFEKEVIHKFVLDYEKGVTPNPCPECNIIKFTHLLDYADKHGINYIGSGHYAIVRDNKLFAGHNLKKDQSYFLSRLPSEILGRIKLPLGTFTKEEIRRIAREAKLHVADKKDSQDICFIYSDYRAFLQEMNIKAKSGKVTDESGKVIDFHNGVYNYTIGQRYRKSGQNSRQYVLATDIINNEVIVGKESLLYKNNLRAVLPNFLCDNSDIKGELLFKIRSKDTFYSGMITAFDKLSFTVSFHNPISAITPGQLATAFLKYDENNYQVLLSGWITEAF